MVTVKLTDGDRDHEYFIEIEEYLTVKDLIERLKKRIFLNNPTLLLKGEPLKPDTIISSLKLKNLQKIVFNDKYNGGY